MAETPVAPVPPARDEPDSAALASAEQLRAQVQLARRAFVDATTAEQYLAARAAAWTVVGPAHAAKLRGPLALALVTAAECAWFAALEEASPAPGSPGAGPDPTAVFGHPELVRVALRDTTAAGQALDRSSPVALRMTWASLATLVLENLTDQRLLEPGADDAAVALALVVSLADLVPASVPFVDERGGPDKAVRLALAMTRAWEASSEPLPGWLADRVADSLDAPRRAARSRLGRLAASATGDDVAGETIGRELWKPWPEVPDVGRVFALVEASSARTLVDGIAGLLGSPIGDAVSRALEREATAYEPVAQDSATGRQLRLVSALPFGATPEEVGQRAEVIGRLESRYTELGVGFTGVASPPPLEAVQVQLEPDQVLVRYIVPARLAAPPHVVVVTAEDAVVVPLPGADPDDAGFKGSLSIDGRAPVDYTPLSMAVASVRAELEEPADLDRLVARLVNLHGVLVQPVLDSGLTSGRERWLVVPAGPLHLLPWMALQDPSGRWLLDDAAVTLVPSASTWMHLLGRGTPPVGQLLALGDPITAPGEGLPRLPGSAAEVAHLEHQWSARGLSGTAQTGARASFATLIDGAADAGVLHIATHGSFPDESALFDQGFQLAPGLSHSGRVTADELRRLPLGRTWCATLSLCNGGAYRVGPGGEPYGLVPALLEAGASTVIAPQWAVDDAVSASLMADVSDHLLDLGPAQALRQAVLSQRNSRGGGPGDHCAFVAIGTGAGSSAPPAQQ
ncbi:CHAT domain-containing protein [Knoellia sp. S7-12]|uniref:CHAT domain-containing protein n=1 Tax=Knoellia sp. S7-12 TaxID=3126698 RepID=UPI0033673926